MRKQWLALEHYRWHLAEQWPEGPRRDAAIAAALSAIAGLLRGAGVDDCECPVCAGRVQQGTLVVFPDRTGLPKAA